MLKNFKSHHGIRKLQIEGESLPGGKNSAHKFKVTFLQHVEEEGYSRDDVYNVDETGVNWKALPRKSLASKREFTAPGFKVSKKRVTAMLCANASGTHTLPLLVIGKSKKLRCFKNVSCLPTLYKVQKSVWMNSAFFSEWYSKDFIPNVKKLREREGKTGKVLLILDYAPCHPPVEILNVIDDDFSVMYFPPNITALMQPMDHCVIEKLKRIIGNKYCEDYF
ncbi:jerky protein homolog [Trichonephila inaurata madagascariensis]|uniref:Jerky protein homolog n=1 Tax=Trichonephila inaurata madagascariensis TaxID=2747483 RepID=A0A8X6YUY0_9ARAC|nr:jerky protein homolog [Trichonephila inaurata madagascariensis]